MKPLKTIFVLLFLYLLSCNSSKAPKSNPVETTDKEMIANDFKKGVIKVSDKKEDCPFVIEIQNNTDSYFYEPVDLPDKFKKDNLAVWVKFTLSRRLQRCPKAIPVLLNDEIHLRN